jgi:phosphogluconate dehydratase
MHEDARTIWGDSLHDYAVEAKLNADGTVERVPAPLVSGDEKVLAPISKAFQSTGGIKLLTGNLGNAIIKTSAVKPERHIIEAPAIVFEDQNSLITAFKSGQLERDFVAVIRFQGPKANGMPELHKLLPSLGVLQDKGFKVALVTDGRMSGASGKVPAAIHVTPEAKDGGLIGKVQNGDVVRVDAVNGTLELLVSAAELSARTQAVGDLAANDFGMGRELFQAMRAMATRADDGAMVFAA